MARHSRGFSAAAEGGLDTVPEIFLNSTSRLPPEPEHASFGLCYVAYVGSHERRYRGDHMLQVAARQARAAASSRGLHLEQCLITDQPERPRPFVDLVLPLRTSADAPAGR